MTIPDENRSELVGNWGQIKLIGVFDHVLSAEEILAIYNAYTRKPWYKRLWNWIIRRGGNG